MLHAIDLSVEFGTRRVLDRLSVTADAGALTAIVGPNGSGKTTLLRALTGEVRYQGRITLNGQDVAKTAPVLLAAQRAVLPQKTALAFPFTAFEVVRIGQTSGRHTARHLPMQALERCGVAHLADQPYQLLSGGEQARVQLARVLVQVWEPCPQGQPCWLFLDEPVASLDIAHQILVMEIARAFADQGGGVIAVMHDLNLTAMFADQVLLMDGGRVRAAGETGDVFTRDNLSAAYRCDIDPARRLAPDAPMILPQCVRVASAGVLS